MLFVSRENKKRLEVIKKYDIKQIETWVESVDSYGLGQIESWLSDYEDRKKQNEEKSRKYEEEKQKRLSEEKEKAKILAKEREEIEGYANSIRSFIDKKMALNEKEREKAEAEPGPEMTLKDVEKLVEVRHNGTPDDLRFLLDALCIAGKMSTQERNTIMDQVDPFEFPEECKPIIKSYNFARYGDASKTHLIEDSKLREIAESVDNTVESLNVRRITKEDILQRKTMQLQGMIFKEILDNIEDIGKEYCKIDAEDHEKAVKQLVGRMLK